MIHERTRAGLATAREQECIGGKMPKLNKQQKLEIIEMVTSGRKSASEAARIINVHPATISRLLMQHDM